MGYTKPGGERRPNHADVHVGQRRRRCQTHVIFLIERSQRLWRRRVKRAGRPRNTLLLIQANACILEKFQLLKLHFRVVRNLVCTVLALDYSWPLLFRPDSILMHVRWRRLPVPVIGRCAPAIAIVGLDVLERIARYTDPNSLQLSPAQFKTRKVVPKLFPVDI